MKLYTKLQVSEAMTLARLTDDSTGDIFKQLTPIELPSDEEIEKSYPYCFQFTDDHYFGNKDCFKEGAKWMKEQILNQNK